jgi:hypothetical protein
MILVSFSLYGNDAKYIVGALRNAELIQGLGSEWQAVFYLGADIPEEVKSELLTRGGQIRNWDPSWHKNGMFWRFTAIQEFEFDFLIFRDVDSRISDRELKALDQWFKSRKTLHIMRDHPHHNALILGGMWGVTAAIKSSVVNWNNVSLYGVQHGQDQVFLDREVYPFLKGSMYINDAFFSFPRRKFSFPSERIGSEYVGESLDEYDQFDEDVRSILASFQLSQIKRLKIFIVFSLHRFRKSLR